MSESAVAAITAPCFEDLGLIVQANGFGYLYILPINEIFLQRKKILTPKNLRYILLSVLWAVQTHP